MSFMSELDYERQVVDVVRGVVEQPDPVLSAEEQVERKVDAMIRELDEFCAMANNPETVDLIEGQKVAFGQMMVRIQLIMGFLLARKPATFRIVR